MSWVNELTSFIYLHVTSKTTRIWKSHLSQSFGTIDARNIFITNVTSILIQKVWKISSRSKKRNTWRRWVTEISILRRTTWRESRWKWWKNEDSGWDQDGEWEGSKHISVSKKYLFRIQSENWINTEFLRPMISRICMPANVARRILNSFTCYSFSPPRFSSASGFSTLSLCHR